MTNIGFGFGQAEQVNRTAEILRLSPTLAERLTLWSVSLVRFDGAASMLLEGKPSLASDAGRPVRPLPTKWKFVCLDTSSRRGVVMPVCTSGAEGEFRPGAALGRPMTGDRPGLLFVLWQRKLVVLTSLLVCAAAGLVDLAIVPPRYLASAALMIDPHLGATTEARSDASGSSSERTIIDDQARLFTTKPILTSVAKQADLARDQEFNGSQRSLLQRWLYPNAALDDGVDLAALANAVAIHRSASGDVVDIDVLARDPKKAADIANGLAQAYLAQAYLAQAYLAQQVRTEAPREATKVRQAIDRLSDDIHAFDRRIEALESRNQIAEAAAPSAGGQRFAELNRTLGDAEARATRAKARLDAIEHMMREGRLDASADVLNSPRVTFLRFREEVADRQTLRLSKILGGRHPYLIEALERQKRVRETIAGALQQLKVEATGVSDNARAEVTKIRQTIDTFAARSHVPSRAAAPLQALKRDRTAMLAELGKLAHAAEEPARQTTTPLPGRLIDAAQPPVKPTAPKIAAVAAISVLSGLLLGIAGALLTGRAQVPHPVAPRNQPWPSLERKRDLTDDDMEWRI